MFKNIRLINENHSHLNQLPIFSIISHTLKFYFQHLVITFSVEWRISRDPLEAYFTYLLLFRGLYYRLYPLEPTAQFIISITIYYLQIHGNDFVLSYLQFRLKKYWLKTDLSACVLRSLLSSVTVGAFLNEMPQNRWISFKIRDQSTSCS